MLKKSVLSFDYVDVNVKFDLMYKPISSFRKIRTFHLSAVHYQYAVHTKVVLTFASVDEILRKV